MIFQFNTLKKTLISYFLLIILILLLILSSLVKIMWDNHKYTEWILNTIFNTTSLSIKLNESYQYLSNCINYKDRQYIESYDDTIHELIDRTSTLDTAILDFSKKIDDMNVYYKFLEIQNDILIYKDKSYILIAQFSGGVKRKIQYDQLYSIKSLKEDIYDSQTDLLFKQSQTTRNFYIANSNKFLHQIKVIIIFLFISIIISISLAVKFSDNISDPIHALVLHTETIGKGYFHDFSYPKPINNEIRFLIHSMNQMSNQISDLIHEIEMKSDLEKKLKEQEIKNLTNENLMQQTEMKFLQSQINPHFLFNTLNMISTLSQIESAGRTKEIVDSLAHLLRYILQKGIEQTCIEDEIAIIDDYMFIQKTRFGDKIQYRKSIDPICLKYPIPPMIFQPFIENAIIHGLEPKLGTGTLSLFSQKDKDKFVFIIQDDGVGIDNFDYKIFTERNDSSKIGIMNTIKRLEYFFGYNAVFIESEKGTGTIVKISFPFHAP